ncbi:MAG: hypothetical protein JWO88_3653 [Frankiales bacterium]|nr:hypothetical protein [Frankiales bacterium]
MGVRLYDPKLGRFLEVDPIEGGSANDYDYCNGDPINCFDLGGTMKTPENKTSANDAGTFLRWYAGLTKEQQQQLKKNLDRIAAGAIRQAGPPPASRPALPELKLTRPGATAADSPNPLTRVKPPSLGCVASAVGGAASAIGLAIATDGANIAIGLVGVGTGGIGVATSC